MSQRVLKDQQEAWISFASAALTGLLSTNEWDRQAAEKAAEHADRLLKEFEERVRLAHGN